MGGLAPVSKVEFQGPAECRALVVTGDWTKWEAWRWAHQKDYGVGIWVLDEGDLQQWRVEAFEVIRL